MGMDQIKAARAAASLASSIVAACAAFAAGLDTHDTKDALPTTEAVTEWEGMLRVGIASLRKHDAKSYVFRDVPTLNGWLDANLKRWEAKLANTPALGVGNIVECSQRLALRDAMARALKACEAAKLAMGLCKVRVAKLPVIVEETAPVTVEEVA